LNFVRVSLLDQALALFLKLERKTKLLHTFFDCQAASFSTKELHEGLVLNLGIRVGRLFVARAVSDHVLNGVLLGLSPRLDEFFVAHSRGQSGLVVETLRARLVVHVYSDVLGAHRGDFWLLRLLRGAHKT